MDGKSTVGTQVGDILGLLAERQRRGSVGGLNLSGDEMTAVERWDDLTESILVAHDPRGRTVAESLAFVDGTLAQRGDMGIASRWDAADRMALATRGQLFGFQAGIGDRWYWHEGRVGSAEWFGGYPDFSFDATYLLLEEEEVAVDESMAFERAGRPFGTTRRQPAPRAVAARRAAAKQARTSAAGSSRRAPSRRARQPLARRPGSVVAPGTGAAGFSSQQRGDTPGSLLVFEDTVFSPTALPALDAALQHVADVWEPAGSGYRSTDTGPAPFAMGASVETAGTRFDAAGTVGGDFLRPRQPMGARFSPARFDQALRVVTLQDTAQRSVERFAPQLATLGSGGGEQQTQAPVFSFAYDAVVDELVAPEALSVDAEPSMQLRGSARTGSTTSPGRTPASTTGARSSSEAPAAASVRETAPRRTGVSAADSAAMSRVRTLSMRDVVPTAALSDRSERRIPGIVRAPFVPGSLDRTLAVSSTTAAQFSAQSAGTTVLPSADSVARGAVTPAERRVAGQRVETGETATTRAATSEPTATRADRYAYASDFSVLPAEIFATSLVHRVGDEAPQPESRYAMVPGTAHVASPGFSPRPSELSTTLDPVVYLSLPAGDAERATPVASGLRQEPNIVSEGRLGGRIARRLSAPAMTVAEATRLQQILAEGMSNERRVPATDAARAVGSISPLRMGTADPAAEIRGVGGPAGVASPSVSVPVGTATTTGTATTAGTATIAVSSVNAPSALESFGRAFGAPTAGSVPRALRNALPGRGSAIAQAMTRAGAVGATPASIGEAFGLVVSDTRSGLGAAGVAATADSTRASLSAEGTPTLAVERAMALATGAEFGTGVAAETTLAGGGGQQALSGLWLRFAGMEPIFLSIPASEGGGDSAAAAPPTASTAATVARRSAAAGAAAGRAQAPVAAGLAARGVRTPASSAGSPSTVASSASPVAFGPAGTILDLTRRSQMTPLRAMAAETAYASEMGRSVAPAAIFAVPQAGSAVTTPAMAGAASESSVEQRAALMMTLWQSVAGGTTLEAGLLQRLSAARGAGDRSIGAFAPTVARLLGVTAASAASSPGMGTYASDEVGALLTLEHELRVESALGSGSPAGTRQSAFLGGPPPALRRAGSAPATAGAGGTAPEVAAWPYLPVLSREVSDRQRDRAVGMASSAAVRRFASGRTAEQFARLPMLEQRAVLQQLELAASPALARTIAALTAGEPSVATTGGGSGAYWGGFAPRGLAGVLLAPKVAAGESATTPSLSMATPSMVSVGRANILGEVPTASAAMRFADAQTGGSETWIRDTLDLLLPALRQTAEGPGGGAAPVLDGLAGTSSLRVPRTRLAQGAATEGIGQTSVVEGDRAVPSRLALTAPEGDLLRLADAGGTRERAPEALARATGVAPRGFERTLAARGALGFADRLAEQVLGAAAESSSGETGSLGSLGTTRGRDVAGPLFWPQGEMSLLAPIADDATGATGRESFGSGATRRTRVSGGAIARHGELAGERASVGRDWAEAADHLSPLVALADGRILPEAASVLASAETGTLVGLSERPVTGGGPADVALMADRVSPSRARSAAFRPGLLRERAVSSASVAPRGTVGRETAAGAGSLALSARFVNWMQERGVVQGSWDRLGPSLADAVLLAMGPTASAGGGRAGRSLGFAAGGTGFASAMDRRLTGGVGALTAFDGAPEDAAAASAGSVFGRTAEMNSFVRLMNRGGAPDASSGSTGRAWRDGTSAGETVSVGGASARRVESADVRRLDWSRAGGRSTTSGGRGAADIGGIAAAATAGREVSRAALPLIAPMAQHVAQRAAAKSEAAPVAEPGGASDQGGKGHEAAPGNARGEAQKIRKVVDQVVARLQERIRWERERRGGVLW